MSRVLIITGMHRSGTSLAASLLQKAGLYIGERLLGPDERNPRGFFEDEDFLEFHLAAMQARGYLHLEADGFAFQATHEESRKARKLIAQRSELPWWGWKEPRTTLFLDFWHELLPEAQFLFLYRHPLEVLASLLRRSDVLINFVDGIEAWITYNASLLKFYSAFPESCLLCHGYGLADNVSGFAKGLHQKLGLDLHLDQALLDTVYHTAELRRLPFTPRLSRLFRELCKQADELYQTLNAVADLPWQPELSIKDESLFLENLETFIEGMDDGQLSLCASELLAMLVKAVYPDMEGLTQSVNKARHYLVRLQDINLWLDKQMEQLKQGNVWLEGERAEWEQRAKTLEQGNHWLEAEIQKFRDGNAYLEDQRARWEARAEEMSGGNAWLEKQRANWQQEAERLRQMLERSEEERRKLELQTQALRNGSELGSG